MIGNNLISHLRVIDAHDIYRAKRKDYRSKLRDFLNHLEVDKIKNLCNAADCNEKLFWKL